MPDNTQDDTTEVTTPQDTPVEQESQVPETVEAPVEESSQPVVLTAPGSKEEAELTLGEHTAVPQPEAPVGSPATAAPAQDAVTINGHLSKVSTDLTLVKEYIQSYLANHEASIVVEKIESIIETVRSLIK